MAGDGRSLHFLQPGDLTPRARPLLRMAAELTCRHHRDAPQSREATTTLRIVLAVFLIGHGIAHIVGFAVPWKLVTSNEVPYHTTVLAGIADPGPTGARVLGIAWLIVAFAFLSVGVGLLVHAPWWYPVALVAVVSSVALCVLGWPDSRLGFIANAAIAAVLIGWRLGLGLAR